MRLIKTLLFVGCVLSSPVASAQKLNVAGFADKSHAYFHALLTEALAAAGQPKELNVRFDLPQGRLIQQLEDGTLDVQFFLRNDTLDQKFIRIDQPLTNGLIGQRILLIRPADENKFSALKSVDDLRATGMVGGFGQGWFDVKLWQANGLPTYEQDGEWRILFKMLASGQRKVDYMARGVTEVQTEAAANPELAIEKNLLLVYQNDRYFYLPRSEPELAKPLGEGLALLKQNGRQAALIEEHYGAMLKALNVSARHKVNLKMP